MRSAPRVFRGEGHLQKALHRVRVHESVRGRALEGPGYALYVRHRARLVVNEHERAEDGVLPRGGGHLLRGYGPVRPGREARHLIAAALEDVEGAAHGVVLHGGAYDVPALAAHGLRARPERPVVALRAAGGKGYLPAVAAERLRELPARVHHQLRRRAALRMGGARVAVIRQHRPHRRLRRLRADAGGGRIVEVYFHWTSLP